MEQKESEVYNYWIKKQNTKTQSTTFTDKHKFNKNKDFYKTNILEKINYNNIQKYL